MLNIEKYKEEILSEYRNISCAGMTDGDFNLLLYNVARKYNKVVNDNWSLKSLLNWFLQEYQEPILNEKEKEYLSNVIKPFKDRVIYICKASIRDSLYHIEIYYREEDGDKDIIDLPSFNTNSIYKGMQIDAYYDLEELGL